MQYALKELEKAIKLDPKFIDALLLKGKLLWSINKFPEGNLIYWEVKQLDPKNQEVNSFIKLILPQTEELLKQTKYLLIQNNLDQCLLNIKKGLDLYPNGTQFLLIRAFIMRKKGEYEQALNNLLLAYHTKIDQQSELEIKNQIALTYNEMAMILYNKQQHDQALSYFNESIQFKNTEWNLYVNRGDCFRALKKPEEALKDYLKAQKLSTENQDEILVRIAGIRASKGIGHFNQGKYNKAIKEFDEAVKLAPNVPSYYHLRAKCLMQIDNLEEAMKDYMKAYELDPTNMEVAAIVSKMKETSVNKKQKPIIYINKDDD